MPIACSTSTGCRSRNQRRACHSSLERRCYCAGVRRRAARRRSALSELGASGRRADGQQRAGVGSGRPCALSCEGSHSGNRRKYCPRWPRSLLHGPRAPSIATAKPNNVKTSPHDQQSTDLQSARARPRDAPIFGDGLGTSSTDKHTPERVQAVTACSRHTPLPRAVGERRCQPPCRARPVSKPHRTQDAPGVNHKPIPEPFEPY